MIELNLLKYDWQINMDFIIDIKLFIYIFIDAFIWQNMKNYALQILLIEY